MHKETDKLLANLEKKITRIYNDAYRDIQKRSSELLSKMELSAKMTPEQRLYAANKYNRLQAIEKQIAETLKNANAEAVRIINNEMPKVYKLNYDDDLKAFPSGAINSLSKSAVNSILKEQVAPFKKLSIDSLKDGAAIRRQLTRELTTGIMQGESIGNLAKRIRAVTGANKASSIRIARTETTRVENSAHQDIGEYGMKLGFKMKKRWVSTSDDRTRPEHTAADGQEVDMDKPFIVAGEELMYPGDESGSAWNTINCRCTTINIIDGAD